MNQPVIKPKHVIKKNLEEVGLDNLISDVINHLSSSQLIGTDDLIRIIRRISTANPYYLTPKLTDSQLKKLSFISIESVNALLNDDVAQKSDQKTPKHSRMNESSRYHLMWEEQCGINFPLLYLSSLYLYSYAQKKGCNTFLFATRDCCHWIKIFKKMFPKTNCHYFNCSRNMFRKATENDCPSFKKYVQSLVGTDIKKTIYVDVHGTGLGLFSYFKKDFGQFPYCFLLSASCQNYEQLPGICQLPYKQDQLRVMVFAAAGTPIEMLNYDIIGTLQNYTDKGPIRDQAEYPINRLEAYHVCMELLINQIQPIKKIRNMMRQEETLLDLIRKIYFIIQYNVPVIGTYVEHQVKHTPATQIKAEPLVNPPSAKN